MRNFTLDDLRTELELILDPDKEIPSRKAFYAAFFGEVRHVMGGLNQSQLDGLKRLLWVWDKFPQLKSSPDTYLPVCLAFIALETGKRMQPVRETFANSDAEAVRKLNAWWASGRARKAGVRSPYWNATNQHPFGRGDIQITHHSNMVKGRKMLRELFGLDVPLDEDYSLALDPIVSAVLAYGGCLTGFFTGKKLADYNQGSKFDAFNSRSIVNGDKNRKSYDMDKDGRIERIGDEVSGMADVFALALSKGSESANAIVDIVKDDVPIDAGLPNADPLIGGDPIQALINSNLSEHPTLSVEQAKALVLLDVFKQLNGSHEPIQSIAQLGGFSNQRQARNPVHPGKEITMFLNGNKPLWKSKTIIGIAGAAVSVFLPQLAPVVDILMPNTTALTPETVDTTRQAVETIVTSVGNIVAALSLLFAGYGRKVATDKL